MNKQMKKYMTLSMGALFLLLVVSCKRKFPRLPIKEYTKACLYMAVLDDEICRNELEGNFIGEDKIVFPPKPDSLQYRYHLFLESYRGYSKKQIDREIQRLEKRLNVSKKFCNHQKENLSVVLRK
ncbi:hypothetical protein [Anaerotignum sp.]|uniref:hypothetical protein n=1 Tax=Anaerotignum sp. TaxID=2039241 RepID=UPI0028A7412C|nr:hypothetical protein [Anaerotignum sp.]